MTTPPAIRALALARMDEVRKAIADAEATLTPLRAELAQLTAWLDVETSPTPADASDQPPALTLVSTSTQQRAHYHPTRLIGDTPRPTRTRPDGAIEHLFPRGAYSGIAKAWGIGTHEAAGVWLSVPEWQRVIEENTRRAHERKARAKAAK